MAKQLVRNTITYYVELFGVSSVNNRAAIVLLVIGTSVGPRKLEGQCTFARRGTRLHSTHLCILIISKADRPIPIRSFPSSNPIVRYANSLMIQEVATGICYSKDVKGCTHVKTRVHRAGFPMDQRSSKRNRTFLDGRIIFNNRSSVISCTVRDLSDTGARIVFGHIFTIPAEFEIEIPKKGLSVWARVMWSNGREHGVKFNTGLQPNEFSEFLHAAKEILPPGSNVPEQTALDEAIIQKILDEAQHQIARAIGAPADTIRLKLEIDLVRVDVQRH